MKTNRAERIGICSLIVWSLLFWVPIICAILGHTGSILWVSFILYFISTIVLAYSLLEKRPVSARMIFFLLCEAMQLIPYGIILVVKGLFF